ncbi:hypothetical protein [Streptomyces sp. C10-9-1]|uniref:hypothetical protein n=1 Tax=Streptomyces sp. C10-9-1 TaxID=1859285 RepID=UPI003F4A3526
MITPSMMPRQAPALVAAREQAAAARALAAAVARDEVLNAEEAAVRAAGFALRDAGPASPGVLLRPYQSLMDRAGWRTRITEVEGRALLESVHPSGALVLVTAALDRGNRVHRYVLHAGGRKTPSWRQVNREGLEYFARYRTLGHGCCAHVVQPLCRCEKRRYPSEARAKKSLLDIMLNKELRRGRRATETRVYRCPDDDRVWHITSIKRWRPQEAGTP